MLLFISAIERLCVVCIAAQKIPLTLRLAKTVSMYMCRFCTKGVSESTKIRKGWGGGVNIKKSGENEFWSLGVKAWKNYFQLTPYLKFIFLFSTIYYSKLLTGFLQVLKILEFYFNIFQDLLVLEKDYRSWKVLEIC